MNNNYQKLTDPEILQELTKILKEKKQLLRKKERLFLQEVKQFMLITAIMVLFRSCVMIYQIVKPTPLSKGWGLLVIIAIITNAFAWFIRLYLLVIKYQAIAKDKQKCERINLFINNHHE